MGSDRGSLVPAKHLRKQHGARKHPSGVLKREAAFTFMLLQLNCCF